MRGGGAATAEGADLLHASALDFESDSAKKDFALLADENADVGKVSKKFIKAIAQHRNWDREKQVKIPA